jgi:hypothetical protein
MQVINEIVHILQGGGGGTHSHRRLLPLDFYDVFRFSVFAKEAEHAWADRRRPLEEYLPVIDGERCYGSGAMTEFFLNIVDEIDGTDRNAMDEEIESEEAAEAFLALLRLKRQPTGLRYFQHKRTSDGKAVVTGYRFDAPDGSFTVKTNAKKQPIILVNQHACIEGPDIVSKIPVLGAIDLAPAKSQVSRWQRIELPPFGKTLTESAQLFAGLVSFLSLQTVYRSDEAIENILTPSELGEALPEKYRRVLGEVAKELGISPPPGCNGNCADCNLEEKRKQAEDPELELLGGGINKTLRTLLNLARRTTDK